MTKLLNNQELAVIFSRFADKVYVTKYLIATFILIRACLMKAVNNFNNSHS